MLYVIDIFGQNVWIHSTTCKSYQTVAVIYINVYMLVKIESKPVIVQATFIVHILTMTKIAVL